MKKYTFKLVITEENDDYWKEFNDGDTGCDAVRTLVSDMLGGYGYMTDGEYKDCDLELTEYTRINKRKYKFQIKLNEGNDEFWEELENKSGCDDVRDMLKRMLSDEGFHPDGDDANCKLILIHFENKETKRDLLLYPD